jgi:ADP-heptose:LPS heptosyltransferase
VAVAAGIPTVTVSEAEHAHVWSPPGTPRHRVACTRSKRGVSALAGTFTNTAKIAEIPVDAAWKEIAVALRQPAQQTLLRHSPRLRAA